MTITIDVLSENSPLLEQVISLGDRNKGTLGFLPRGAFIQASKNGRILIAAESSGILTGYLLYRIISTQHSISITHLCIDEKHRGKGIARQLVEKLKDTTTGFRGIGLFSRRDYDSNQFWPHVGFVYKNEKNGRGRDRVPLTYYWYEHAHPSLLSLANEALISSRSILAVLDANVFYEVQNDPNHPLLGDWLLEDVALCITPELFNEINRNKNASQRKASLRYAQNFAETQVKHTQFDQIYEVLKEQYASDRIQDRSDLKHLAHAVTANADFFITRDTALADQIHSEIYITFGISTTRPEDLIIHADELVNAAAYQPNRLAGTHIEITRVRAGQTNELASGFQQQNGEKKSELADKLRKLLGHPETCEVNVVQADNSESLGIISYDRAKNGVLHMPLIRLKPSPVDKALGTQLIFSGISKATNEQRQLVRCTESYCSQSLTQALIENSFEKNGDAWTKFNLTGVQSYESVDERLKALKLQFPSEQQYVERLRKQLAHAIDTQDVTELVNIERLLWPLKLRSAAIPTFIVSIRSTWAMDLFDSELGKQTLFGSNPSLIFRMENVYYRSANSKVPTAPSRVLWYISKSKGTIPYGTMAIRACSYVDEVVIGTPKDLFKRFSKLGVYQWSDVFEAAKNDINKPVLAFRFSRTELFEKPVSFETMKTLLKRNSAPLSPLRISDNEFGQIYQLGRQLQDLRESI